MNEFCSLLYEIFKYHLTSEQGIREQMFGVESSYIELTPDYPYYEEGIRGVEIYYSEFLFKLPLLSLLEKMTDVENYYKIHIDAKYLRSGLNFKYNSYCHEYIVDLDECPSNTKYKLKYDSSTFYNTDMSNYILEGSIDDGDKINMLFYYKNYLSLVESNINCMFTSYSVRDFEFNYKLEEDIINFNKLFQLHTYPNKVIKRLKAEDGSYLDLDAYYTNFIHINIPYNKLDYLRKFMQSLSNIEDYHYAILIINIKFTQMEKERMKSTKYSLYLLIQDKNSKKYKRVSYPLSKLKETETDEVYEKVLGFKNDNFYADTFNFGNSENYFNEIKMTFEVEW